MNRPFVSNDIITTSMKICLIDEKTTAVNKQQMSIIKNDEEKIVSVFPGCGSSYGMEFTTRSRLNI